METITVHLLYLKQHEEEYQEFSSLGYSELITNSYQRTHYQKLNMRNPVFIMIIRQVILVNEK